MDQLLALVAQLMASYPALGSVLVVVGVMRVTIKPIMSALVAAAGQTETKKDDEFLAGLTNSKVYKTVSYILDWFGSIKLPQAKK